MTLNSDGSSRLSSFLYRQSLYSQTPFSAVQAEVDGAVSNFLENSASLSTFACILAGGGASRLARTGILSLGANATGWGARAVQAAGAVGSLGAEVVGFEAMNRFMIGLIGPIRPINLWSWNGEGGLRQGLFSTAINFTAFRGAGRAAQGQNVVFQHAAQSTAMVLGHNIAGALNILPRPEGALSHQFFHAEFMTLELGAGMAFVRSLAPGIHAFERSLDLTLHSFSRPPHPPNRSGASLQEAYSIGGNGRSYAVREKSGGLSIYMSIQDPTGEGPGDRSVDLGRESGAPSSRRLSFPIVSPEEKHGRVLAMVRRYLSDEVFLQIAQAEGHNITRPFEQLIGISRLRGRLLAEVVNRGLGEEVTKGRWMMWRRVHRLIEQAYAHFDYEMVEAYLEAINGHFGVPYLEFLDRMREVKSSLVTFERMPLGSSGRYVIPRNDYLRDVFLRQSIPENSAPESEMDLLDDPVQLGLVFGGTFRNHIGSIILMRDALRYYVPNIEFADFLKAPEEGLPSTAVKYRQMLIQILRECGDYSRVFLSDEKGVFHRRFLETLFHHKVWGIRNVYPQIHDFVSSIPIELRQELEIESLPPLDEILAQIDRPHTSP